MTGDQFGQYRVLRPLARGGMGETLLACDGDGRLVVLKRLLPQLQDDVEAKHCFQEESRIARRLRHANVVELLDDIQFAGQQILVFEYVEGCSARDLLADAYERRRELPVEQVVAIVENAARGLDYTHCMTDEAGNPMGLVHRDVSPANVLVGVDGMVKIIDFGVAKAWDTERHTATGIVKGKVGYLSPEHARGEVLDARADVFSLGVVFWELLVGDRLFQATSASESMRKVMSMAVAKPSARRRDVPARIDAICQHALERDRAVRTQSAGELCRSLSGWRVDSGVTPDLAALVRERFPAGVITRDADDEATQVERPDRPRGSAQASNDPSIASPEGSGEPEAVQLLPEPWRLLPSETGTEVETLSTFSLRPRPPVRLPRWLIVLGATLVLIASIGATAAYLLRGRTLSLRRELPDVLAQVYLYDFEGATMLVTRRVEIPIQSGDQVRSVVLGNSNPLGQKLREHLQGSGPGPDRVALALLHSVGGALAILVAVAVVLIWSFRRVKDVFGRVVLQVVVIVLLGVASARFVVYGVAERPGLIDLTPLPNVVAVQDLDPPLRDLLAAPSPGNSG